jgi:hypothetical protein
MPQINDDDPVPYVRSIEGKTETMIPIGLHEAVNETSAKALGLLAKQKWSGAAANNEPRPSITMVPGSSSSS